jgi:hypothetical protein
LEDVLLWIRRPASGAQCLPAALRFFLRLAQFGFQHPARDRSSFSTHVQIIPPPNWKPPFAQNDDEFTFMTCIQNIDQLKL